jgi:Fe-S-cluster containining protein
MKRNCSLDEISDGKLYEPGDLVEASCNGCNGRAACCHGMGTSIILDPFDIYRLTVKLGIRFESLLAGKIELNVVDGIILPSLKMTGEEEGCAFLDPAGRCSIHAYRPGICRIFPLGRYYEKHDFKYFLQPNECLHHSKSLVKVAKWIDTADNEKNKQFLVAWHYFLNAVEEVIKNTQDDTLIKNLNMYLLNNFYIKSYDGDRDFYPQFEERLTSAEKLLGLGTGASE